MASSRTVGIVLALVGVGGLLALLWFIVWTVRRSEDPRGLIYKWIATLIVLGGLGFMVFKEIGFSVLGAFAVPFLVVGIGVLMSILWAPHLGALLASPITSMFDGGNLEVEPQPLYSMAIAKRKVGKYRESIYAILEQLERFPTDAVGQMMIAEIQAENLLDLEAAENTVMRLCSQPGHAPQSLAMALNQLADWHLKYGQDREGARRALEHVVEVCPDSEQAQLAAERLAHLARTSDQHLLRGHEAPVLIVPHADPNLGLRRGPPSVAPEEDPAEAAQACIAHLAEHPADGEVREKLAGIYAGSYGRPDLAAKELQELVSQPHQPARSVAKWLNQIADYHLQNGGDLEGARETLQQVIDLFPGQSYAENARRRMDTLRLELRKRETSQAVKLGSYEEDLGLRKPPPGLTGR